MKRFHILLWKDFFTLNTLAHLVFKIVSRNTVCRHVHNVVIWPLTFCVSRCVQRAVTQVPHWAASSKTVPTSTTTGVLWSQVSAALCPPSPHITSEQSAPTYPYACLQVQCAQLTDFFFFFLEVALCSIFVSTRLQLKYKLVLLSCLHRQMLLYGFKVDLKLMLTHAKLIWTVS